MSHSFVLPNIVAVEEDELENTFVVAHNAYFTNGGDDHIPGPPPPPVGISAGAARIAKSSRESPKSSHHRNGTSFLRSNSSHHSQNNNSSNSHAQTSPIISSTRKNSARKNKSTSELELSSSDRQWAGNGILANAEDLALAPEAFAAGCNLLQAAARGDICAMKVLLHNDTKNNTTTNKEGSNSNSNTNTNNSKTHVNFRDYDRRTALHVAASEGHLETVRFLVEDCDAKVNRSDRWGGSPLDDAHRHRHMHVVEFLRQHHGAATGSGNQWANLIQAAADGDYDEVTTLLHFFVPQNNKHNYPESTTTNINNSDTNDVNRGDYDKRTALHLAAGEGHTAIVRALCEAGADVNVEDRWKRRPLDDAEIGHHSECVELLVSLGAIRGRPVAESSTSGATTAMSSENVLDRSSQRAMDNMLIEFTELEMIDRIGSGAFGEIYKCRWRGTLVAAKIIKSAKIRRDWTNRRLASAIQNSGPDNDDRIEQAIRDMDQEAATTADLSASAKDMAVADFRQEISVLKSLRHPHIVLLLAYSTTDNYECIISELMKCSLLDVFRSHWVQGTRISARTQIVYATQLALGMNYLHTCKPPIIHRDLKPANLLIDHAGGLKISDFGLSKVRPDLGKNETDAFVMTGETGSYRFMAPEVFRHEEYNTTVDVYSYAMILFYLLVGRPPWPNLAGLDAVRRASNEGDRPNIPRCIDERLQILIKECWHDRANVRPPFNQIITVLAKYSKDEFKEDTNTVLTTTEQDRNHLRCHCVIQ